MLLHLYKNPAKQKHSLENTNWDHTEQVILSKSLEQARLLGEFLNARKVMGASTIS